MAVRLAVILRYVSYLNQPTEGKSRLRHFDTVCLDLRRGALGESFVTLRGFGNLTLRQARIFEHRAA
jgi:hypothetical protein